MQKQEKKFYGSQEQFFNKTVIWDRTPSHLYIKCSAYVWGRAQGSQIFKQNSIISICSKVMAFLVILLSPWSPCHPRIVPVILTSSLLSPCHLHNPQKVPMWSPSFPSSPLSPLSPLSPPMLSPLSLSSPHCTRHPHIIPIVPTSSRRSPDHSQPPR